MCKHTTFCCTCGVHTLRSSIEACDERLEHCALNDISPPSGRLYCPDLQDSNVSVWCEKCGDRYSSIGWKQVKGEMAKHGVLTQVEFEQKVEEDKNKRRRAAA